MQVIGPRPKLLARPVSRLGVEFVAAKRLVKQSIAGRLIEPQRVVDRGRDEQALARLRAVYLRLPEGSRYTLRASLVAGQPRLSALLERALPARPPKGGQRRPWLEIAAGTSDVRRRAGWVTLTRGPRPLRVISEETYRPGEPTRLTPELSVKVLHTLPGGTLQPKPGTTTGVPPIDYPAVSVRHYSGAPMVLTKGPVVRSGDVVLPESFRWHRSPGNRHSQLNLTHDLALAWPTQDPAPPVTVLEGTYFYWDYDHPGHYGHLMTEAIAKLWGWEHTLDVDPEARLLVRVSKHDQKRVRPDLAILAAYGVPEDRIVWLKGPVQVSSLVGASPLWHNAEPAYVHPQFRDTLARLSALGDQGTEVSPRKIFIGRKEANRFCRNNEAVEQLFVDAGFTIIRPSVYSLPDQARIFRDAEVVAGFGGTGMFNLAYARSVKDVIVLNQDAYDSFNEQLFAAALGASYHVFVSPADLQHPPGGFSYEAFQSDWEFDFATHERPLKDLLSSLG